MPSVVTVRPSSRTRASRPRMAGPAGEIRLVVLDDGRCFHVDAEEMARHGLTPGAAIADDLLGRLESRDAYLRARELAVRLLALRPRSIAEVRRKLRRHRVPDEPARAVLDDLAAAGYLDDRRFACGWVANRIASRPCGVKRLRWELREKGIPPAMIEQAIREALGEEDLAVAEEGYARALVARRSSAYRRLSAEARMRRLAGLLQRRGFASTTIARVLRTLGRTGLMEISEGRRGQSEE